MGDEEECLRIINLKNYYEVLGLEKTADETQIKKAYRKLALKFHPDKNKCKNAEEAFKKVNQAFCVLSDKQKRKNYDMFGTEEGPGISTMPNDFNPFDIFEQFFGEGFQNFGGGHTRVTFSNGNGFTVFTSGGFGNNIFQMGEDDDDENPFEQLFGFGRRVNRSNRERNGNGNERNRRNRRDFERQMSNISLCVQFFPIFCCLLVFVIVPWISKLLL